MLEVITETGKEKNMKLFNELVEKKKKEKEEKMMLKEKELIKAVRTYDYAMAEKLLKEGVNVNCTFVEDKNEGKVDYTPLTVATKQSDTEMMKILISAGADLEQTAQNLTPLSIAIYDGSLEKIDLLVKSGANLNSVNIWLSSHTPLTFAIKCNQTKELIELLLELGADINGRNWNGDSAVMCAAIEGNAEIVKLLIDKGAILTLKSNEGYLYATDGEYPSDYTALMYACVFDKMDVAKVLLDAGLDVNTFNSKGWSPLILATMYGRTEMVKVLIDAGANIDWQDKLDVTPLMYAVNNISRHTEKNMTEEWHVDLTCYKEIVGILIQAGADVNLRSKYGATALHSAVCKMRPEDEELTKIIEEVITLLVNAGADPYIEDMTGNNCFVHMCRRDNSKTHLLVKKES